MLAYLDRRAGRRPALWRAKCIPQHPTRRGAPRRTATIDSRSPACSAHRVRFHPLQRPDMDGGCSSASSVARCGSTPYSHQPPACRAGHAGHAWNRKVAQNSTQAVGAGTPFYLHRCSGYYMNTCLDSYLSQYLTHHHDTYINARPTHYLRQCQQPSLIKRPVHHRIDGYDTDLLPRQAACNATRVVAWRDNDVITCCQLYLGMAMARHTTSHDTWGTCWGRESRTGACRFTRTRTRPSPQQGDRVIPCYAARNGSSPPHGPRSFGAPHGTPHQDHDAAPRIAANM